MSMAIPKHIRLAAGAAAVVTVAAGMLTTSSGSSGPKSARDDARAPAAGHVVRLDVDGPSFTSMSGLQASAPLIVKGVPLRQVVGTVPGSNGVPQTIYNVRVDDVVQGDIALVGKTISVFTLGGTINGTTYQADGLETLTDGSPHVFFLAPSSQGGYYPLGGAALAPLTANGTFTLDSNVTGHARLTAPLSAVTCRGKPARRVVPIHTIGRKGRARFAGTATRRIGNTFNRPFRVKLVHRCVVVATGTLKGKQLRLSVRPLHAKGRRPAFPVLRGTFLLLPNGGPAISARRVNIR
jgi:hypothetical protein